MCWWNASSKITRFSFIGSRPLPRCPTYDFMTSESKLKFFMTSKKFNFLPCNLSCNLPKHSGIYCYSGVKIQALIFSNFFQPIRILKIFRMNNNKKPLTGEQKAQIENNRLAALERKRVRENKRLEAESLKAAKQKKKVPISQVTAQIKTERLSLKNSSYPIFVNFLRRW